MNSKTIYTSNYARISQFIKEVPDARIVATSCWVARWHKGAVHEQRLDLAPTWEIVDAIKKEEITWEEYAEAYLNLLQERKVDPKKLIKELPNNTFLLCFESPTDHCHRFLLADWVRANTGFQIEEWMTPKERKQAEKENNLEDLIDLQ